jgi:tetratricopeptide (TPR) repeat protein
MKAASGHRKKNPSGSAGIYGGSTMSAAIKQTQSRSITAYLRAVELVQGGALNDAARIAHELRSQGDTPGANEDADSDLLRRLLSIRLALKSGNIEDCADLVESAPSASLFACAEADFVRGLVHYHRADFAAGIECFRAAADKYHSLENGKRELLSRYNIVSGRLNLDARSTNDEIWLELRDVQRLAEEQKNYRVLGLIRRQNSYTFQSFGRRQAALIEIEKALPWLEACAPRSDYQLGLLQMADCLIDLDRKSEAQGYIERVIPPLESRVEFPLAMIEAKINGRLVDPAAFDVVTPAWRMKLARQTTAKISDEKTEIAKWNPLSGELRLSENSTSLLIKARSLEGRLLQILLRQSASKAMLCEALWPGESEILHVENRLHQLIRRFNQKTSALVKFDGGRYQLARGIEVFKPTGGNEK